MARPPTRRLAMVTSWATVVVFAIGCDDVGSSGAADRGEADGDGAFYDLTSDVEDDQDAPVDSDSDRDPEDLEDTASFDLSTDSVFEDTVSDLPDVASPDLADSTTGDLDGAADVPFDTERDESSLFGEVGVTVLDRAGPPVWGAVIVQQRADGSVARTVELDAAVHVEGRIALDLLRGDGVTVVHQREDALALYTVLSLLPGDEVTVQDPRPPITAVRRDATQLVALPEPIIDGSGDGSPFTAARFAVTNGCRTLELSDRPDEPVRLDFASTCLGEDDTLDILAWALDAASAPIAFTSLRDHPYPNPDVAALPAWQAVDELDTIGVSLMQSPLAIRPSIRPTLFKDGRSYSVWPAAQPVDPTTVVPEGGEATATWLVAPTFAEAVAYHLTVRFGTADDPLRGEVRYARRDPTLAPSTAIDLTDELLGRIQFATIDQTSDPARPYLSWYPTEDEMDAGAIELVLQWTQALASAPVDREWTFLGPPDLPDNLRLPTLPAALEGARPTAAVLDGELTVSYWQADFIGSYRDWVNEWGVGPELHSLLEGGSLELGQYALQVSRVTTD